MIPTNPVDVDVAEEPGWSPRLVFSLVSIVLTLELLSVSYAMISMALPDIVEHYQTAQGAWLVSSFLLLGAVVSPLVGKLADVYGKRRLLLLCLVISAVGSVISAVAPNFALVIAGRALAGTLVPCLFLSYSLIRDVFPAKTVPLAVSISTAGMGLITIASPFLTGWLIDDFGWRSIFWFFAGVLVVLTALVLASTPESDIRLRSRVDFLGAVLLGVGIASILIAVSFGPSWGWAAGPTLGWFFAGVVLLGAWLTTSRMIREPLVKLDVLRQRSVLFTVSSAGMVYGASSVYSTILPIMAMTPAVMGLGYGFGVDAEGFAIFQVPLGAMAMIGGLVVGFLCSRGIPARLVLVGSTTFIALGAALTAFQHDSTAAVLGFGSILGFGLGLGYGAIPNLLIKAAPPEVQASTASLAGITQSLVAAITPVVAFTIMNNWYIAPLDPSITQGAVMYTDGGMTAAFLVPAVAGIIGLVTALAIPRRFTQFEAYTENTPAAAAAAV
ncbi:MFS transporter [Tomitella gaofuii]|uniref:MFS transporter n=1 Tax=Tomitella gaofuii TaxID=2760083 RepID=UPI0015FDAB94|nr:MFS transporter [Tomitella gaofuii]